MNAHWRPFSVYFGLIRNCLVSLLFTLFLVLPSLAQDFTAKNIGDYGNVTVMEVSGNYDSPDLAAPNSLPRQLIAKEFFKTHKDEYDFLVIFSNFDFIMPEFETLAFYHPVKNDTRGIGHEIYDNSTLYGSNSRLQGTIDMGNIAASVTDPLDPKFDRTLSVLAHELLHRWGSYVKFKDWNGNISNKLIGQDGTHWSFLLNSNGSLQYGNQWRDNGDGSFTSVGIGNKFSPLDLYLMGMIDKSQVPPMLLIENPSVDPNRMPEVGVTITGTPRYITIDDIIAAEGERIPSAKDSQKQFKTAFIFIAKPGTFTGQELDGIENVRNGFLTRFSILTDGKALVQVASAPKEDIPFNPGVRPPTTTPRTLPPNVEDGVRWLTEHQLSDGSWTDFALTTELDTAESVTTLQRFPVAQHQFQAGIGWLASNASANTDFLARRLEAAAQTGGDAAALVSELLSRRNGDGGWGSGKNFISNPTDTALALKALARSGYAAQQVISKAITYLKSAQKSDGGWSGDDTVSMIQPTAAVLTVFNAYRKSFPLEENISRTVTFLTGKQNADGGFGNSPSTVYDSALAVMALQESGADKEMISRGVGYLNGLQTGEGSWQESPYQTALAVRAVWQASIEPDLAIKADDITFIPETITTLPTTAVINVVITNLGRKEVPQAKIVVYDGAVAPEKKVAEQTAAFPGQAPVTVTFAIPITDGNGHVFNVVVDPEGAVKEADESNNTAVKALYPQATFDFEVAPAGVNVTPNPVDNGQQVTITAQVSNKGTSDAFNVPVRIFIDDGAAPLDIVTVNLDIPAGGSVTKTVTWQASRAGSLALAVAADPANAFLENDEANNKAVALVTVNPVVFTDPNLTVSYKEIVATPNPVSQTGSVNISATVHNDGFADAADVRVEFYKGVPGLDGVLLGSQTIAFLKPSESATVSIPWGNITEAGEKVIYVKVDPANAIKEISKADNAAFTKLTIQSLADLAVYNSSISFTPYAPKEGDPVSIGVTVFNKGDLPVSNVTVQAFDGTASLGSQTIASIAGNSQAIASFALDTTGKAGSHQINVSVVGDASTVEQSAANNAAAATLIVYKADLMLSEPYFSPNGDGVKDTTRFSLKLDAAQTVSVEIVNKKGEVVRWFNGSEFSSVTACSIVWDGFDGDGKVVADGEYSIQVKGSDGVKISDVAVVVDNDRTSLIDALLTDKVMDADLSCRVSAPEYGYYNRSPLVFLSDGSGALYYIRSTTNPNEQPGLYKLSPDGTTVETLITKEWLAGSGRTIDAFIPSPDGSKIALVTRLNVSTYSQSSEVWVMDSDGGHLKLLDTLVNVDYYTVKLRYRIADSSYASGYIKTSGTVTWSPDSKIFAYPKAWWNGTGWSITGNYGKEMISVDTASGEKKTLLSKSTNNTAVLYFGNDSNYGSYGATNNYWEQYEWSTDGTKLFAEDWTCYSSRCWSYYYNMYVADKDGNSLRSFTDQYSLSGPMWINGSTIMTGNGQVYPLDSYPELPYVGSPRVIQSQDKKIFAFAGDSKVAIYDDQFRLINTITGCPSASAKGAKFSISPDNKKLLCYVNNYYDTNDFNIIEIATNKLIKIGNDGYGLPSIKHEYVTWLKDSNYVIETLEANNVTYLYFVDLITGSKKNLKAGIGNYSGYVDGPSIYGDSLQYLDTKIDTSPSCVPKSVNTFGIWSMLSSANLVAELVPLRRNSGFALTGSASDLNFQGYRIEYAAYDQPGQWYPIISYAETPISNGNFGTWVPPAQGSYYLRLTVWDKAGNAGIDVKKVTSAQYSSITDLYKSGELLSPDGDGVKDSVQLSYNVLEPLHVVVTIFDQNNTAVRTFTRDYASPTMDQVSWDGRNDSGVVVPDGTYRFRIADYDFFVKVDTSFPEVGLAISQMERGADPKYFDVTLSGHTFDSNLKQWTLEYGEGDNPQQWYTYKNGTWGVAAVDSNNNVISPAADTAIQTFSNQQIGWLAGKKFRITAEDFAGKKTSAVTGFVEEKIALYLWSGDFVLNDVLNPYQSKPGIHAAEAVETVRTPLVSAVLQHGNGTQWGDAQPVAISDTGILKVSWDNSAVELPMDYQVRIKAVDALGREFYSNTLKASQPNNQFKMWSLCTDDNSTLALLAENPYDSLSKLSFQIRSSQDSRYATWTDFGVLGDGQVGSVPVGGLNPPHPDIKPGTTYQLRMMGTGTNGETYLSNEVTHPSACSVQLALEVKNTEADCDTTPGASTIQAEIKKLNAASVAQTLSYYLQRPQGPQLLRKLDLSREQWGGTVLDTAGMAEGNYEVRAVLTFLDPSVGEVKATEATATLLVDRQAPTSSITYPTASLQLCAGSMETATGNWFGIPVEGVVADNTKVKRFELLYGVGANPTGWQPAKTRSGGKTADIKGTSPITGEIGVMDVTDVRNTDLSLKLMVIDLAGNATCSTTTFQIKPVPEVRNLATSASIISPNGDGIADTALASYVIDGFATLEVKVFPLNRNTNGSLALGPTPVRTVSSARLFSGGNGSAEWDGKNDAGVAVPDGMYAVAVSAMDGCSNSSFKWVAVEVDKTPPSSLITYPKLGDTLGVVAEVRGTAEDLHFWSYLLEAGEGDDPATWIAIASGAAQVKDNVLGKWNTFGRQGRWTLRLTVEDGSGNKSATTSPLDLVVRQTVIKAADAVPKVISPNNDDNAESSLISYEVTDASQVKIEILNSVGAVLRDYATTTASAGSFGFTWDGRDNAGTLVPDGIYNTRITAALAANTSVMQIEAVTVVVDTTKPRLEITQPLDNAFLNKTHIPIAGTVDEANLASYRVTVSGPAGAVALDSGSQARSAYTFGTLNDAAEGSYSLTADGKDVAGNNAVISRSFTVDRTAPSVTLASPKNDEFYGSSKNLISISGSIDEKNLERYAVRYGYGTNPYSWQEVASGTTLPTASELYSWKVGQGNGVADGVYTVSLYAKDKAGAEKEVRAKVIIDNTKPTVSISSPANGGFVKGPFTMYGTVTDNNFDKGTLEMSEGACAGAYKWSTVKEYASTMSYSALESWEKIPADGDYCVRVSAVDKLGNQAQTILGFKVDTVPPTPAVLKGALENKVEAALSWLTSPEIDVAGYNLYRGTEKLNVSLLSQLSYRDLNLKEGAYSYTVKAVDLAGNESGPSNVVKLVIDTTPPAARIIVPADGSRVGGEVDIRGVADSPDDFKQYRVYLGAGADPTAWNLIRTSPAPTPNGILAQWDTLSLAEGVYSIKLEAEDLYGNVNSQRVAVTVDNTPPAKPQLTSLMVAGSNVTITWSGGGEADLAGYLLYKDDKLINAASIGGSLKGYLISGTTYQDTAVSDGRYSYYVIAMDQEGNLSDQSNTVTVNVDARAPHAELTKPTTWVKFAAPLLLEASAPDLDVASVQYQYKKSTDSAWTNLGSAVTTPPYTAYFDPQGLGLPYAVYQLRPVATDQTGHKDAAPVYREVTYDDVVPPAAPTGFKATLAGNQVTLTWDPNQETDLKGYNIVRRDSYNWTTLNYNPIQGTTYVDKNLYDGRYTYEIEAIDNTNNRSAITKTGYLKVYAPLLVQPFSPVENALISLQGSGAEPGTSVEFSNTAGAPVVVAADAVGNFRVEEYILAPGENRITARTTDAEGNVSKPSAEVVVVLNEAPAAPTGLVPVVQGYNVELTWNSNTETDLAGYNLYRDGKRVNLPIVNTLGTANASSMYEYYDWYRPPYYVAYKPSNAFDGLADTYWASYGYGSTFSTQWWELALPAKELVSGIEINWGVATDASGNETSYAGKDFEIQAWSGTAWMTLTTVQGNTGKFNKLELRPYATDKIRVSVTATNDPAAKQVRIAEVKLSKESLITAIPLLDANLKDGSYRFSVTAVDRFGLESAPSEEAAATVGDVIAPAPPTGLSATALNASVTLGWMPVAETDVAGYNVYRGQGETWSKVNAAPVIDTSYLEAALKNGNYSYRVTALDTVGNESVPSVEAAATVFVALPPTPANLRVAPVPQGEALNAEWNAVSGSALSYNLYRGITAGGPYSKVATLPVSTTSFTDSGLTNGSTYYYVIASVDAQGNESVLSAEAAGMATDTIPPGVPVITSPTMSGTRAHTYDGTTDIAGTADPGATVQLFKGGVPIATATPVDSVDATKLSLDYSGFAATVSPTGNILAYLNGSQLVLQDFSGTTTAVTNAGYSPLWNSTGTKLAYLSRNNYWRYKVAVYDLATGVTSVVNTTDPWSNDNNLSWSADGKKMLYTNDASGYSDLYLKDLETGGATKLTNWIYAYSPQISPDGKLAAYFDYNTLKVVDAGSAAAQQVDTVAVYSAKAYWSPDSKKLAFISTKNNYQNLYCYDTAAKTVTALTNTNNSKPGPMAWSPDGGEVAYIRSESDGYYALWLADTNGNNKMVLQKLQGINELRWKPNGELLYVTSSGVNTVFLGSHFIFRGVPLDAGENIFYAKASDAAGNATDSSGDIRVSYDTSRIPDALITSDDIFIYPPFPRPGEEMSVNVLVRNPRSVSLQNVDVDIYAWDVAGELELLKSTVIGTLSPNYPVEISLNLNAGYSLGARSIIVVVDAANKIKELDENNNFASAGFAVTDQEKVMVSALLDNAEYPAHKDAEVTVTVGNSGAPKSGTLTVGVEDADGNSVSALGSAVLSVPYGPGEAYRHSWNTGSTLAGTYKARAVFTATDGTVTESSASFAITPELLVETGVATDKQGYRANEQVQIAFKIKNGGSNYIIPEARAVLRVFDAANNAVFSEQRALVNMFPGSVTNLSSAWNTGIIPPGTYRVVVEAYLAEALVSTSTATITINPGSRITGSVSVDPAVVPAGGSFRAAFTLYNSGNAWADGVVKATVVDTETGEEVLSAQEATPLPVGGSRKGEFGFDSLSLQTKSFQVRLKYLLDGKEFDLSSAGIKVQDVLPPVVTAVSPQAGGTYNETLSFTALASDAGSGLSIVEYQLDGGAWLPLPVADYSAGRYAVTWSPTGADSGVHTVSFRATDRANNTSFPISTSFTFEYTSDYLPPVLYLSTLADGASTTDQTLNLAGRVWDDTALQDLQVNGEGVSVNSDGSFSHPVSLQLGSNVVTTVATDVTGNRSMDVRTIKLQIANLTVATPADNSKTAQALVMVSGTANATDTVTVSLGGKVQYALRDSERFTADVTLLPGLNTIVITATAPDGFATSAKRTVLYDDQKPSLAVTEPPQDIRTNQGSIMIKGTASDLWTSVGVSIAVDGVTVTPPLVNGSFEQPVALTEEKQYTIIVTATNEVGTQVTVQRNVIHDTTPPELVIDPLPTQTNQTTLTVTGRREEGAEVSVFCATAEVGEVTYPSSTTWSVTLTKLQLGPNIVTAASSDAAGNPATVSATVAYTEGAPDITVTATPDLIWPTNHKLVPVVLGGEVVPHGSGLKSVSLSVADEYGEFVYSNLKFGDTVLLEAWREGNDFDGRVYTITAVVTDNAGSITTKTTIVRVMHDQSK